MREKLCFNRDWYFHKGDINPEYPVFKSIAYIGAKTERMHMGPAFKKYWISHDKYDLDKEIRPEVWENVNLPHDYLHGAPISPDNNSTLGFVKYENAWYVKKFNLTQADKNRRLTLVFEGVSTHATVYLNGCLLKHNFCGYTTFEVDITNYVKFDEENSLAVYVNTENHEGWWYEGGGIYRHVWLYKTDFTSIDLWGVYVRPLLQADGSWNVNIQTTLRNDTDKDARLHVEATLLDGESEMLTASANQTVAYREKADALCKMTGIHPELWSPDSPRQYAMKVRVYRGKTLVDEETVKFGFRSFTVDPNNGLFINGKHYLIKGVCGHTTCGMVGKAMPDNLYRYRAQLYKDMGANGYRTSHYPQPTALMDALDEMGFIVMDETRWFESTDEGKEQLAMLVKRDRNRPCVFFWSIGNEEPHFTTLEGNRIMRENKALVKKLDPDRMVMTACDKPDTSTIYEVSDVIGINYCYASYENVHKKYPNLGIMASECCATGTTRGWYTYSGGGAPRMPAYDSDTNSYFIKRETVWKFLTSQPWIMGGYQWMSIDYRGEGTQWPRLCSVSGAYDLYYQRKDAFYQNLSHWTEAPMVHILPHWNFAGLEGENICVVAYTNAERVKLILNGKVIGEQQIEKYGHGEWQVAYEQGTLRAEAYIGDKLVAVDEQKTTGKAVKLKLTRMTPDEFVANGEDVALITCTAVDENGNEVPTAAPEVNFQVTGAGKYLSSGSDSTDHTCPYAETRKMYAGKITVAVKAGLEAGDICLFATSPNLDSAALHLTTTPNTRKYF